MRRAAVACVAALACLAGAARAAGPAVQALPVTQGPSRAQWAVRRDGLRGLALPSHAVAGYTQRARLLADGRTELTVVTRAPAGDALAPPLPAVRGDAPPEVAALAEELRNDGGTAEALSARILTWVSANIVHQDIPAHDDSALATLEHRTGSCVGRSELAVALLRAAGFPARTVHGLLADASAPRGFILHRYVESYLPGLGWVPSDPGESVHVVDARHVFIATDEAPYDPDWQANLKLVTVETLRPLRPTRTPMAGARTLLVLTAPFPADTVRRAP